MTISFSFQWPACFVAMSPLVGCAAQHGSDFRGTATAGSALPSAAGFDDLRGQMPNAAPHEEDGRHGDLFVPHGYPEPFGADLTLGWFEPWPHSHFSRRGTPFVHLFNLEPAFLDQDLFFDYRQVRGADGDEREVEVELEWAFTRRIGLVVEAPYVWSAPSGQKTQSGLGDVAIAPRLLLVDSETFLLSGSLEVALPSGEAANGLGRGEVALAPSLSSWLDLGNWFQASVQLGTEHGLETGSTEVFYNGALAHAFLAPNLFGATVHSPDNHATRHFPAGLTSLIAEFTGRTVVDGQDDGRDTGELLFGLSHNATTSWEVRFGYQAPIGSTRDIDDGFVLSLVCHF